MLVEPLQEIVRTKNFISGCKDSGPQSASKDFRKINEAPWEASFIRNKFREILY